MVKMYTKNICPFCVNAKMLLQSKGIAFEEINVESGDFDYNALKAKTGMMTVPQIFINDKLIGGFQELSALNASGELDKIKATL